MLRSIYKAFENQPLKGVRIRANHQIDALHITNCDLTGFNFPKVDICMLTIIHCNLKGIKTLPTDISWIRFVECTSIPDFNFNNIKLNNVRFEQCDLSNVKLHPVRSLEIFNCNIDKFDIPKTEVIRFANTKITYKRFNSSIVEIVNDNKQCVPHKLQKLFNGIECNKQPF